MAHNINLRHFLKEEALRQMDGDYDLLYNYVRAEKIGDKTFRELLLPFFGNENGLIEIESTLQALTIFVPTLSENSFSAETWNTTKHNTNFEFEASGTIAEVVKVGGKYGASLETTQTASKPKEWTESSDDLGEAKVHFGDNIIIDEHVHNFPIFQIQFTG